MERKIRVLVVDDDPTIHVAVKYMLKDKYECAGARNSEEALAILARRPADVLLLDVNMSVPGEGLHLLERLRAAGFDAEVVMLSASQDVDVAVRAIRNGAAHYLLKEHSLSVEPLVIAIESALERRSLMRAREHHDRDRKRGLERSRIVGESEVMRRLGADMEKLRRSGANVIILGETGTGKELVAKHIGSIDGQPFVTVDSATITSSMAESILFGHVRGAFTGAHSDSKGLFEEADGGTIYFDEIANMPLEIQTKLLRVVQEKEVTRVGSTRPIPLDFRVVCAANQDLEVLCQKGLFKFDLFQRLGALTVTIPPLRERKEDVALLVAHFLREHAAIDSPAGFTPSAMERLLEYSWPGNVRELSNLIANLCTMGRGKETLGLEDLPDKIRSGGYRPPPRDSEDLLKLLEDEPSADFYACMRRVEGRLLTQLYELHGGNVSRMSRALKVCRSHLYSKLQAHGIHR